MKRDAGLLFAACWIIGLAYFFVQGRIYVIGAFGVALVLFGFGALFLVGGRQSPTRLRSAIIAAGALAIFAAWGALR